MPRFVHAALAAILTLPPAAVPATPLFDDDAPLAAELAGPLAALMHEATERRELPFLLRTGDTELAIKVRLRGKSRLRVCEFLNMRLNFRQGDTAGTPFAGQDKLKLVVPCHLAERDEKNLLEEYAAYRIFNLMSAASYRVRLLQLTYNDGDAPAAAGARPWYAFVIESDEELASRLGGRASDLPDVALAWLDARQAALVYVFQYLIGNTDWSLVRANEERSCCHNGTLIETDDKILYVPYDFDLSGLVDAPYAFPAPDLRLRSVTQRRYRGFCTDHAVIADALDAALAQRQPTADVIAALPALSDKDKAARIGYLDQFFAAAGNEHKLLRQFERRCLD